MSAAAMAGLLQEVSEHGTVNLVQRKHLREATEKQLMTLNDYGPLLKTLDLVGVDGGTVPVLVVNALSLIAGAFHQGGGFTALIQEIMATNPCTPGKCWNLILYTDEVVPGNVLSHQNQRKVTVCYISILELGAVRLSQECSWLTLACVRSSILAGVQAGLSQLIKVLVKDIFQNPDIDVGAGGLLLKSPSGDHCRIHLQLGCFVQDGCAHRQLFCMKGDNGTRCCFLCKNVVSTSSGLVDEDGTDLLVTPIVKEADLDFSTDTDVWATVSRLCTKHSEMNKKQFAMWQQACGMNYQPESLLFDSTLHSSVLHPTQQFLHDWMHMLCVSGIVQTTLHLFMEAFEKPSIDFYSMVAGYLDLWTLPAAKSTKLSSLFTSKRHKANKEAKSFKCTASECLGLLPIMAHFVEKVVMRAGNCLGECQAFLAVANLLELLQSIPHGRCTPALLRQAVSSIQEAFQLCNWTQFCHPKFHWMIHLPQHLARFKCLPSCWVHGRKHRITKRYATEIQNTTRFERSCLIQVVGHDLALLLDPDYFSMQPRLHQQCRMSKKVLKFFQEVWHEPLSTYSMCAAAKLFPAGVANKSDVVLLKGNEHQVGEVWLFAEINGATVALVSMWALLEKHVAHSEWQAVSNPQLIYTRDIACTLAFKRMANDKVVVIIPVEHRM